jgi:hypothetical protein
VDGAGGCALGGRVALVVVAPRGAALRVLGRSGWLAAVAAAPGGAVVASLEDALRRAAGVVNSTDTGSRGNNVVMFSPDASSEPLHVGEAGVAGPAMLGSGVQR